MDRENRTLVLTVTAISVVAVLFAALIWPGSTGPSSSAATLFDEQLVEDVYQRVSPAVVEIHSDRILGDSFVSLTSGSGFLVDKEGHIVTNNHVIQNADRIRVSFVGQPDAVGEVRGRNPANDLALLKVDPDLVKDIEPVTLGDSSRVRPGQLVIIIGSPFGLNNSVSVGVTSGVDRGLPSELGRFIPGMLQTDALISPGNSGGPMLNSAGQVVGVTTAIKLASSEVSQRVGFGVPINTFQDLLPRLKEPGVVRPPWLGTLSQSVNPLLVERLELPVERGFYVIQVLRNSPAERAGLVGSGVDAQGRPSAGGDIIVAVNGVPVATGADLTSQLNLRRPGDAVALTVVRQGEEAQLEVTLGEWPSQLDH